MKKTLSYLLAVHLVWGASAQSTEGWISSFSEDFADNRMGWSTTEYAVNPCRINFDQTVLVLVVTNKGESRSTAYTQLDFNQDFILKATVSMKEEIKGAKVGRTGVLFGHSHQKYTPEQGTYEVLINYQQDKVAIKSSKGDGSPYYKKQLNNVNYSNKSKTVIGVKKEGDSISFYINEKMIYKNLATSTQGGAITFLSKDRTRGLVWDVNVYQKDTPPTAEEVAQQTALNEAVSEEERRSISEALSSLEFASGKSLSRQDSVPALNKMAEVMAKNTRFKVLLKGHTDDVGSPTDNLRLSQARVDSVIEYLVNAGIKKNRLEGIGFGDKHPIANNDLPEGRRANNRIELEFLPITAK